jgi:hypothetical protein
VTTKNLYTVQIICEGEMEILQVQAGPEHTFTEETASISAGSYRMSSCEAGRNYREEHPSW